MTYAFVLDASACSGCKACQVACKDKNQLPPGVLWRRVYEVTGGGWKREGAAWTSTLFAYNLSLSCAHCAHPKCVKVCPVKAYTVRPDGIVRLDSSKCIGCKYCAWACPYEAPQYDPIAKRMTKCDFCYDNLELGLPPACVAACPMRVLDYTEVRDEQSLQADRIALWEAPPATHPYPMPKNSHTGPHLAIKPHAAMRSGLTKQVANREEVQPQKNTGWEEAPLVIFTLLIQMAVGGLWAVLWLSQDSLLTFAALGWIGVCLGAGLAASFAHLGQPRNAWRIFSQLSTSWLSREILFTILFGAGWLATFVGMILRVNFPSLGWLTALIGLNLLYCMSRVYRLPAVPAWDSWRTGANFFISAALLGSLGVVSVMAWFHATSFPRIPVGILAILLLMTQAVIAGHPFPSNGKRGLRSGLILAGVIGCAAIYFIPGWFGMYSSALVLLIILTGQAVERWFFYQARPSG